MQNNLNSPESIREFVNHFQKSRVLLTAIELDIFTALANKPKTSGFIAKTIKADLRATDRLMNALCAIGFLKKEKEYFRNTELSEKFFVKGKHDYMSGLMHTVNMWNTWTSLTDCVIKGTSVIKRSKNINNRDKFWLEAFIEAMHYRASRQANEIVKKINLNGVKKVLDVGGGSGAYAMAFANANSAITATVFDLPNVIPITLKYIFKEKMTEKVDVAGGDYNKNCFPKGYDIIFLSALIHINSYEENVNLTRKCSASLNTGGQIIVQDQIMDDSRISPASGALFALNMLVGTEKGDTYTEMEIREWFKKAGIVFHKRINTFPGNSLIIGKKR